MGQLMRDIRKIRPQCDPCLRNSNMICWGCYDLTVARRCMGQNLIPCFSFSFHYLLFLVCVQFTRNTGKVIPLFCVLASCSLVSVHVLLYYGSGEERFLFILLYFDHASNARSWIRLVNSSEAEIQVSVATYDAHTFSPRTNTIRSTSTYTSLSNLVGELALLKIH